MQAYLLLLFLSLVCTNAIRYKTVVTEIITFDENYTITETSETITLEEPERRVPILLG
jgi:hypothetical protein